jgi:hypothetical protein
VTSTITYPTGQDPPTPGYTNVNCASTCTATSVVPPSTITSTGAPTKLFVEGPITVTLSPKPTKTGTETKSGEPLVHKGRR